MSWRSCAVHVRLDRPDGHPQAVIERAHPLGVTTGEVVVDGDDVDPLALQRVEIGGQSGDERLAFASDHLGDIAAMQNHAAHELDVIVSHLEESTPGLATGGERLGQEIVQRLPAGQTLAELDGLRLKSVVGERLHRRLELIDGRDHRSHPPDLTLV